MLAEFDEDGPILFHGRQCPLCAASVAGLEEGVVQLGVFFTVLQRHSVAVKAFSKRPSQTRSPSAYSLMQTARVESTRLVLRTAEMVWRP